jgi:transcriptional regulator with XRE-family HTH domain
MAKSKKERMDLVASLGRHLAVQRKKRGVTLDQLALSMDISKGNLSDIENGKRDPRYSTLVAIAKGLHLSTADLLKGL